MQARTGKVHAIVRPARCVKTPAAKQNAAKGGRKPGNVARVASGAKDIGNGGGGAPSMAKPSAMGPRPGSAVQIAPGRGTMLIAVAKRNTPPIAAKVQA